MAQLRLNNALLAALSFDYSMQNVRHHRPAPPLVLNVPTPRTNPCVSIPFACLRCAHCTHLATSSLNVVDTVRGDPRLLFRARVLLRVFVVCESVQKSLASQGSSYAFSSTARHKNLHNTRWTSFSVRRALHVSILWGYSPVINCRNRVWSRSTLSPSALSPDWLLCVGNQISGPLLHGRTPPVRRADANRRNLKGIALMSIRRPMYVPC